MPCLAKEAAGENAEAEATMERARIAEENCIVVKGELKSSFVYSSVISGVVTIDSVCIFDEMSLWLFWFGAY